MIKENPGEKIVALSTLLYMLTLIIGACFFDEAWQICVNGTPFEKAIADNVLM